MSPFREPLHQNLDALVGQFEHPHDDAHGADGMDVFRLRVFHIQGFLRGEEDHAIARERRLDRLDRHFASDEQREHHIGEDDDISHRHKGSWSGGSRF